MNAGVWDKISKKLELDKVVDVLLDVERVCVSSRILLSTQASKQRCRRRFARSARKERKEAVMKKKASRNGRWVMAAAGVLLAFERSTISRSSTSEHEQRGRGRSATGGTGGGRGNGSTPPPRLKLW